MNSKVKKEVDLLLSMARLRRTGQRRIILSVLLNARKPQTADEIIVAVKSRINKVTVYRTLESMVRTGLVHKVLVHKRAEHFELADRCTDEQCHPHFTCVSCGTTNCIIGASTTLIKRLKDGFIIHRQQVHIEGLCPRCA